MVSSSVIYVPQGSISHIITYMTQKNFDLYEKTDKYITEFNLAARGTKKTFCCRLFFDLKEFV